jgi:hypothetical protein
MGAKAIRAVQFRALRLPVVVDGEALSHFHLVRLLSLARFRGASSSHPTRAQVRDPLSDRFPWCPLSGVLTVVCGNAIAL